MIVLLNTFEHAFFYVFNVITSVAFPDKEHRLYDTIKAQYINLKYSKAKVTLSYFYAKS